MPFRLVAVHACALCVGVAAAEGSPPPLLKVGHVSIVHRHVSIDAPDLPAALPQAQAKFVILGGQNLRIEAAHLLYDVSPYHGNAAAGVGLAHRPVPFDVAEQVVDRFVRVPLTAAAAD